MKAEVRVIQDVCAELNALGFASSPRIVSRSDFDLSGFGKQESDVTGVDFEYVTQSGPGISGDDYHGTVAVPISAELLFVCDFST